MKPILLIDFGSTYTKVTAVDVDSNILLGTAGSYTTVQSDINNGLAAALELLEQKTGKLNYAEHFACSSAAGGLRMITSGLVPELTAEAAKQASLGAGAKVVGVYSYQLTEDDISEIDAANPDIILLTGGTDGGNSECMLYNANMLAQAQGSFPIVIAGNRTCGRECQRILQGRQTYLCENVMPKFGTLNIEPAQRQIREIFLQRIIQAKGLSKASELISGILMPTPAAMLKAMKLLSDGYKEESGIGELIGIDVGGATTDIYSVANGMPAKANTVYKGLPEPYAKRTVEGDIGMRYSIHGIAEAAGFERISELSGISPQRVQQLVEYLADNTETLPYNAELAAMDFALASLAVEIAVTRHAGKMEQVYTAMGLTFLQSGKDLSEVKRIVVTGGSLVHSKNINAIAAHALYQPAQPMFLKPKSAQILVDRSYILSAMGLLSEHYPENALRIMKKELLSHGNTE